MKSIIVLLIVLFSFTAQAQNMTGAWNANGATLVMVQMPNEKEVTVTTTIDNPATGLVTLKFDCLINYRDGKVYMLGVGNKFKAVVSGATCILELVFVANGIVVGERPGRKFHAEGKIAADATCTNGVSKPVIIKNLDGIWN